MYKTCFAVILAMVPTFAMAQDKLDSVEQFIADSESIVIAKATRVGPVNIIARSNVDLDILLVAKGNIELKNLSISIRYRMEVGRTYLVRLGKESEPEQTRDVVIEVHEPDNIELLKTLSPRIVVLRTINIQLDRLDSIVRSAQYEIDHLKKIKTSN